MRTLMIKIICFSILSILTSIALATSKRLAFYDANTGIAYVDGVYVSGLGLFDVSFRVDPVTGIIELISATEGNDINEKNRFSTVTNVLEIDQLAVGPQTFWLTLNLVKTEPTYMFSIGEIGRFFEPTLQTNWLINYSNSFPDDIAILNANGTASIAGFPGTASNSNGMIQIDLGLSIFNAIIQNNWFGGTFNHFNEQGSFTASPENTNTTLLLNNDRFAVTVDWNNPNAGSGPGQAVPLTFDSGAFYFFVPEKIDLVVRTLDACAEFNHFWVFASATTDVEYELTITDTKSGAVKSYNNTMADPAMAITDTQAFATCP